jgi:hypothetical protein
MYAGYALRGVGSVEFGSVGFGSVGVGSVGVGSVELGRWSWVGGVWIGVSCIGGGLIDKIIEKMRKGKTVKNWVQCVSKEATKMNPKIKEWKKISGHTCSVRCLHLPVGKMENYSNGPVSLAVQAPGTTQDMPSP